MQIVIQRKHIVEPTKSPNFKEGDNTEKYETWKTCKYCGRLEHAIDLILHQNIYESDAKTLKELRSEILLFKQEMNHLLHGGDSEPIEF